MKDEWRAVAIGVEAVKQKAFLNYWAGGIKMGQHYGIKCAMCEYGIDVTEGDV